jgi:hypothetical protein
MQAGGRRAKKCDSQCGKRPLASTGRVRMDECKRARNDQCCQENHPGQSSQAICQRKEYLCEPFIWRARFPAFREGKNISGGDLARVKDETSERQVTPEVAVQRQHARSKYERRDKNGDKELLA